MTKLKKVYSLVIIIFTLTYVAIVIYPYKSNIIMDNKGGILAIFDKIKNVNISELFKGNKKYQVIYENVKQNSEMAVDNSFQDSSETTADSSAALPKAFRKAKLNRMNENQIEYINEIKSNEDSSLKDESTVKEVSSIIQSDAQKYKITSLEKERLLNLARKLAPIDQAKIENYLKNQDESDVIKTLSLLKERLTDSEYEKLKDLELKFQKSEND